MIGRYEQQLRIRECSSFWRGTVLPSSSLPSARLRVAKASISISAMKSRSAVRAGGWYKGLGSIFPARHMFG